MTEIDQHQTLKKGKATDLSKHIAEILVHYRRRKHLSQRNIAELIGVSFQQYQKYEKGKDRLSLERAIMMCEQLSLPLTVFMGADNASPMTQGFAEEAQESYTTTPTKTTITDEQGEAELLALYRSLPAQAKKDFLEMIKPLAKMVTNK